MTDTMVAAAGLGARRAVRLLVAAAAAIGAAALVPRGPASATTPTEALAELSTLEVKGRAPKTGYERAQFGPAWSDDVSVPGGHNGCSTRDDILARDLTDIQTKAGTHGCVVLSGVLNDPYSGAVIDFVRGPASSEAVQIDHVVALSDAWQKGAAGWDAETRRNFANDPDNLQATAGWANQQKGDGDAATWLPPNRSYRCTYATRIVDVKSRYRLWVTPAENAALARILTNDCAAA